MAFFGVSAKRFWRFGGSISFFLPPKRKRSGAVKKKAKRPRERLLREGFLLASATPIEEGGRLLQDAQRAGLRGRWFGVLGELVEVEVPIDVLRHRVQLVGVLQVLVFGGELAQDRRYGGQFS